MNEAILLSQPGHQHRSLHILMGTGAGREPVMVQALPNTNDGNTSESLRFHRLHESRGSDVFYWIRQFVIGVMLI